jgi:hypothetical protein
MKPGPALLVVAVMLGIVGLAMTRAGRHPQFAIVSVAFLLMTAPAILAFLAIALGRGDWVGRPVLRERSVEFVQPSTPIKILYLIFSLSFLLGAAMLLQALLAYEFRHARKLVGAVMMAVPLGMYFVGQAVLRFRTPLAGFRVDQSGVRVSGITGALPWGDVSSAAIVPTLQRPNLLLRLKGAPPLGWSAFVAQDGVRIPMPTLLLIDEQHAVLDTLPFDIRYAPGSVTQTKAAAR